MAWYDAGIRRFRAIPRQLTVARLVLLALFQLRLADLPFGPLIFEHCPIRDCKDKTRALLVGEKHTSRTAFASVLRRIFLSLLGYEILVYNKVRGLQAGSSPQETQPRWRLLGMAIHLSIHELVFPALDNIRGSLLSGGGVC